MRKALVYLLALTLVPVFAHAFDVRKDRDGEAIRDVQDVGVQVLSVNYTQAQQFVLGSTIAIYGVLLSSAPNDVLIGTGATLQLQAVRSTSDVNGELLVPEIWFTSAPGNNQVNTFIEFDPPILAPRGFSAFVTTSGAQAAVFYRHLATNTVENFFIPRSNQGNKVHSTSLYGLQVASAVIAGALASSTGTSEGDFTNADYIRATGNLLFYGFMLSTCAPSDYVAFESTNATTGDWPDFLPPIFPLTFQDDRMPKFAYVLQYRNPVITFPWPLIVPDGLMPRTSVATRRVRYFVRPRQSTR